jgi:hypothetical protein
MLELEASFVNDGTSEDESRVVWEGLWAHWDGGW